VLVVHYCLQAHSVARTQPPTQAAETTAAARRWERVRAGVQRRYALEAIERSEEVNTTAANSGIVMCTLL
jgi:hypothetical protein